MKIYKVAHYFGTDVGSEHDGYTYHTNKREAKKAVSRNDPDALDANGLNKETAIEVYDVGLNKKSILSFLNAHCAHPDNG